MNTKNSFKYLKMVLCLCFFLASAKENNMVALAEGFDLPFDVSQEYLRAYRIFSD